MRKLSVFNNITLDGYFSDPSGSMSWAHQHDEESATFVRENAKGASDMIFGRVTYDMMAGFWPTPAALNANPVVAKAMNEASKIVFSKTLTRATWNNTRLVHTDPATEVRRMKEEPGRDLIIFGSGTIVCQLAQAKLIDEYQLLVVPVVLGSGRTLFEGLREKLSLKLLKSRIFRNGNAFLCYGT